MFSALVVRWSAALFASYSIKPAALMLGVGQPISAGSLFLLTSARVDSMKLVFVIFAGITAVGLLGCAAQTAQSPAVGGVLEPGWDPPPGQRCALSTAPKQLPSAAQVLDTARLASTVASLPERAGHGIFMLGYDSLGVADSVRVVGSSLAPVSREALLSAVAAGVRKNTPFPAQPGRNQARENTWSVLLRIDLGQPLRLRIGRVEMCSPVLTNRSEVAQFITREWGRMVASNPGLPPRLAIVIEMTIDTTGTVAFAHLAEPVPYRGVVEMAQRAAVRGKFLPARLNRRPVQMKVWLPFQLVIPEPPTKPDGQRPER